MRDPGYELQLAYKTALNGNISYNSQIVPVLDRYDPVKVSPPYIRLEDQTGITDQLGWDKDHHAHDTTTLISITTRFPAASGSSKPSKEIGDLVMQQIGDDITLNDIFKAVVHSIDSIAEVIDEGKTFITITRNIRFRDRITEL